MICAMAAVALASFCFLTMSTLFGGAHHASEWFPLKLLPTRVVIADERRGASTLESRPSGPVRSSTLSGSDSSEEEEEEEALRSPGVC